MKLWFVVIALLVGTTIWFRTRRRWSAQPRANVVAFTVFLVFLGSLVGLFMLTAGILK